VLKIIWPRTRNTIFIQYLQKYFYVFFAPHEEMVQYNLLLLCHSCDLTVECIKILLAWKGSN